MTPRPIRTIRSVRPARGEAPVALTDPDVAGWKKRWAAATKALAVVRAERDLLKRTVEIAERDLTRRTAELIASERHRTVADPKAKQEA